MVVTAGTINEEVRQASQEQGAAVAQEAPIIEPTQVAGGAIPETDTVAQEAPIIEPTELINPAQDVTPSVAPETPTEPVTPVIEETPTEPVTPAIETPTPVVEETPVIQETPLRSLDEINLADNVREVFTRANETGLSQAETLEAIRMRLTEEGFDISNLSERLAPFTQEFGNLNLSSDDFFSGLMGGTTYGAFYQNNSADYQQAKELFDNFQAQDKSEQGIYEGIKGSSIKPSVLNKLKDIPEYATLISSANRRIINENIRTESFDTLYTYPVGQQVETLNALLEGLGVDGSGVERLKNDAQLSSSSETYLSAVEALNNKNAEKKTIADRIRNKFPNASNAFLQSIISRETQVINGEIADLEAQASTNKTAYDFRLGQITNELEVEEKETNIRVSQFNQLRQTNYARYAAELQQANSSTKNRFQFLTPSKGVVLRVNPNTGESTIVNLSNVGTTQTANGGNAPEPITTAGGVVISGEGSDFTNSNYINQYPRSASFKNNNPAGVTFGAASENLRNLWRKAGIDFEKGTARPSNEGDNYVRFENINDGIAAMQISLRDVGFKSIKQRLMRWVGGDEATKEAYANSILRSTFGSEEDRTFDSLSNKEFELLTAQQLKREDVNLYNVLEKEIGAIREDGTIDYALLKTKSLTSSTPIEDRTADIAGITLAAFGSRASDGERETVKQIVESMPGATRDEILQTIYGFKFDDEDNQNYGNKLLNVGRISLPLGELDAAGIAALIRTGNDVQALNKVELSIDSVARNNEGDNYISESNTRQVHSKVNEINTLIETLNETSDVPLGNFEGTFEGWIGRFRSGEAARVAAQTTLLISRLRKDLIGANITSTESSTLEPIIPVLGDSVQNFLIKTSSLKHDSLLNLNSQRNRYGLPTIDEDGLLNTDSRVAIYKGDREVALNSNTYENEVDIENNKLSQNPFYNFTASSIVGGATSPLSTIGLGAIAEGPAIDVTNTQGIVNAFKDLPETPVELMSRIIPSAVSELYSNGNQDVEQALGFEGKTIFQLVNEANDELTKSLLTSAGVDDTTLSSKVGSFLSADIMFGAGLFTRGSKLFTKNTNTSVQQVTNRLDRKIENQFISGIKPASIGDSVGQQANYRNKSRQAVFSIVTNKDNLKLTDELGLPVKNVLPENVQQFNESIGQVKGAIYEKYNALAVEAGQSTQINVNSITDELTKLLNDRSLRDSPNFSQVESYANGIIKSLQEEGGQRAITDVQKLKQGYNSRLQAFYRNPDQNNFSNSIIDTQINNLLGKKLDEAINSAVGGEYAILKQQYGALVSIEKDVSRAALRDTKTTSTLLDYADIFSAGDVAGALATGNAGYLAKGGTQFFLKEWYRAINSPNRRVKGMFNNANKALTNQ